MYINLEPLYSKFKSLCDMSDIVTKSPAKSSQSTILERKDIRHFSAEFGQDLGPAQPSNQWECAALKSGVQYSVYNLSIYCRSEESMETYLQPLNSMV
jgi:hypothetical protein